MVFRVLINIISVTFFVVPIFANNPLYLTPLIEQNKTAEARNSSLVNLENSINVRSYSGFLTVDERYNSNIFFWYFPNANKALKDTPWIIWLQGGPGGSSLIGLFSEMGPFELVDDNLKLREYSWCKNFSMVFIDNPVGAGFSFTEKDEGYPRNSDMLRDSVLNELEEISYRHELYNLLNDDVVAEARKFVSYVTSQRVRTAIHVANQSFMFNNHKLHQYLLADFLAPVSSKIQILLQSYNILIYCGQLDLTTPCVLNAEARRRKWRWSGRDLFLKAPRLPWWSGDKVAGYVKSGGGFTEVLVSGAGHLAAADKPAELQQLITYFINGLNLPIPPSYEPDMNIPNYEEYVYLNRETNVSQISSGLIASVVVNVLLLIGIVVGGVLLYRWKRRYNILPFDDSVLTLS